MAMKKMTDKLEKILAILENENPSESEKFFLDENLKDEKIRKFVSAYKLLKKTVSSSHHIDSEILGEYILYKRGEDASHNYMRLIVDKIEQHLKTCEPCHEEYKLLSEELDSISAHLEKSFEENRIEEQPTMFLFRRSRGFITAVTAVVVLLVSYFGLRIVSDLSMPQYKQIIVKTSNEGSYVTRGRNSVLFQKGLNALENKNFEQAIEFLKEDISKNKDDISIFYSYYVLGLTYLNTAESDFLGAFKSYDHKKVNKAIQNLDKSIDLNQTGYYDNLILDAHYFIAKAYLMLDKTEPAKIHLREVIKNKGKYYKEAKDFLAALEKN